MNKDKLIWPKVATLLAWLHVSASAVQADCLSHRHDFKLAERFQLQQGVVTDKTTQLDWQRCPAGMRWSKNQCQGQARLMRLDEARQWSKQLGAGWRLPKFHELGELLEHRCQPPAINAHVFPNIEFWVEGGAPFWTDTPVPNMPPLVYFIDFYQGQVDGRTPRALNAVRAVRATRSASPPLKVSHVGTVNTEPW